MRREHLVVVDRASRGNTAWLVTTTTGAGSFFVVVLGPARAGGCFYRGAVVICHGHQTCRRARQSVGQRLEDSARVAWLQLPNHPQDAVSFSALNDLQQRRAIKGGIRLLQPFADGLSIYHVR